PGIGSWTICYNYTDSLGCSATVCNTINVIFCCDSSLQISAGNDTTICAGGVAVLTANGCPGTPTWYVLTPAGPIPAGQGPIFDALPQQSTCYMVICCDPLNPACCDTDTVCVYVQPAPLLSWPETFTDVCQNGGPITLNPFNVFVDINATWVMVPFSGGTGFFSGPGVAGNVFTPPGIGSWTICYNYTDSLGCSATVCNTINVIFCCDSSLQISAGNDTTICAGGVAVLTANGCPGTHTWYALTIEGPVLVGQGPVFDALPQQSTCYMVICCDPLYPACCDTDTVCVFVNPVPVLSWPNIYPNLCQNGGPVTLNPDDILVWVNNAWVPSSQAGGTGVYSGQGLFGNVFNPPPGQASYLITFTYTIPNGCSASVVNAITVINCCDPAFQISAGNNQTICAGQSAVLTVTGCNGIPSWYALTPEGPLPAGTGEVINVTPQQSTCYMVICCDPLNPACCDTDTVCINVIPVISVGPITGTSIANCLPAVASGSFYNVPAVQGASYLWTVPAGMTINTGQGTAGIFVSWTGAAMQSGIAGPLCVQQIGPCGIQMVCVNIDLNAVAPVRPPSISGPGKVCPGDIVIYSVAAVPRATVYNWTLPPGMNIVSGAGTNVITVAVTNAFSGGTISLTAGNVCGTSPARTKSIGLNIPLTPGPISGPTTGMCNATGVTYSIAAVPGALSYQWTVSNGTIVGSSTGTSVTVNWNPVFISGSLTVRSVNNCGLSNIRMLSVSGAPAQPGPVSGPVLVCFNNTYQYSVATVSGALIYDWTASGTILSGQGTKDVLVQYGSTAAGNLVVSVSAANSCGSSAFRNLGGINLSSCLRPSEERLEYFMVFPNPAHEQFEVVYLSKNNTPFTIEMMDAEGRVVYRERAAGTGELYTTRIDLNPLASGVYMVILQDTDGLHQQRVIVY
ncbi:MAG: T9SS type A sorting domain-containing protein, partial [Bacteroidia bacterium]|nr:T9SS type A sorting domain-containing protein [Bacteroidia bacterium]